MLTGALDKITYSLLGDVFTDSEKEEMESLMSRGKRKQAMGIMNDIIYQERPQDKERLDAVYSYWKYQPYMYDSEKEKAEAKIRAGEYKEINEWFRKVPGWRLDHASAWLLRQEPANTHSREWREWKKNYHRQKAREEKEAKFWKTGQMEIPMIFKVMMWGMTALIAVSFLSTFSG